MRKSVKRQGDEELQAARALADAVGAYLNVIRYVPSSVCALTQSTPTVGNKLVDAYEAYRGATA